MHAFPRKITAFVILFAAMGILLACQSNGWQGITTPPTGETPAPLAGLNQPVPLSPGVSPTPMPTLGSEVRWSESEAAQGIVVEVPNEVAGGQDLYLIRPDGSPPSLLVNLQGVDALSASSAPNGKWLAIETEPLEPVHELLNQSLSILSLDTFELKPLLERVSVVTYAWSSNGESLAYSVQAEPGAVRTGIYDAGTNDQLELFKSSPPGSWRISGWTLENQFLLIVHFLGGGRIIDQAALLDASTGALDVIYTDPAGSTQVVLPSPDGQTAIVVKRNPQNFDQGSLSLLTLSTGVLTPLAASPDYIASLPVWSPDANRVALTLSDQPQKGLASPLSIVLVDTSGRRSTALYVENPPMLIRPLGWASNEVLIVNNLGREALDQVVYSVQANGSNAQKISWGRFLTTVP